MRTVPNMYILNLAISDIIYLTVILSEAFTNRITDKWTEGDFLCRFLTFCRRLSVGLSVYSVAVFGFLRYRVVTHLSFKLTWRDTVATISGVWIVAALFAVPTALSDYVCSGFLPSKHITYYIHVVIFELLASCVLPLCVVAFSYVMTARHLVESSRPISEETRNPLLEKRSNTAKIVVGLALVFIICYVLCHAFWTYFIYSQKETFFFKLDDYTVHFYYKVQYTYIISTGFLLINSCFNPITLFFTSSPFRRHLRRYLPCFTKADSPPNDTGL
jgi:hypothetical protein